MTATLHAKKVLVTGAGGFIGSHLVERLVDEGARVRAFVRYTSMGNEGWLAHSTIRNKIEVFAGDICDQDSVENAMRDIDYVFHLAALIGIPYSYHAPESYVRTNVLGTLNVLRAARTDRIERVIITSTSEVYGSARYTPIDEGHPLQGQSPYSASKIAADKLAESFHLSFGLPIVTIRPFNTFGPRQSDRAIIPTIISQLLVNRRINIGNPNPTRDFNYVSNTVDGFVLATTADAAIGKTINLGSGNEISIGDLVHRIARLLGVKVQIGVDEERCRPVASEVQQLLADYKTAQQVLGWQPVVDLDEGIRLTIAWIKNNMDKFRTDTYRV